MEQTKTTALDVKLALARAYKDQFFITECKNGSTYFPSAQGLLKFDGLAIKKSWTRPTITIFEIKVNRSDFLQDNKWHLYLQYCHEFYFVVPTGLIKKEELPDNVGLQYFNPVNQTIRTVKKALYRQVSVSSDLLMYIFMNRISSDRVPFFGDERCDSARYYLQETRQRTLLGKRFGSKLVQERNDLLREVETLRRYENDRLFFGQLMELFEKYHLQGWNNARTLQNVEEAIQSKCPLELKTMEAQLSNLLATVQRLQKEETENS